MIFLCRLAEFGAQLCRMIHFTGTGGSLFCGAYQAKSVEEKMDNYERAMSGYVFKRGNEELAKKRVRAKDLCFRYNNLLPSDSESRAGIIDSLIGQKGRNCCFTSPFFCDYGEFIKVGDNFFCNYNCKILDGGKVTFGDDVQIGPDCIFATPSHPLDPQQRLDGL